MAPRIRPGVHESDPYVRARGPPPDPAPHRPGNHPTTQSNVTKRVGPRRFPWSWEQSRALPSRALKTGVRLRGVAGVVYNGAKMLGPAGLGVEKVSESVGPARFLT